jgi:hypothetical protein
MSANRRNKISGQFASRLIEMLESPAYRALSQAGRRFSRSEVDQFIAFLKASGGFEIWRERSKAKPKHLRPATRR